jgi:hypothetical protein
MTIAIPANLIRPLAALLIIIFAAGLFVFAPVDNCGARPAASVGPVTQGGAYHSAAAVHTHGQHTAANDAVEEENSEGGAKDLENTNEDFEAMGFDGAGANFITALPPRQTRITGASGVYRFAPVLLIALSLFSLAITLRLEKRKDKPT